MDAKLAALIERLEKATVKLEGLGGAGGGGVAALSDSSSSGASGPALVAFDDVLSGAFAEFAALSKTIGGLVAEQVCWMECGLLQSFLLIPNLTLACSRLRCWKRQFSARKR